jgi:Glycosyltransferases, probably involved in cell wall biogenesis
MLMIEVAFWICLSLIAYAYAGYPLTVWVAARLFGGLPTRPRLDAAEFPFVSILIAAHNEEAVIAERLRNALAVDYPADRLEVVVASDGSTDRTTEIVGACVDPRVRLLHSPLRRGKARVLNAALKALRGEIVLLTDANTFIESNALRQIVPWFADSATGVVCGRLVLTDGASGANSDGLYWRYETFMKECEGRLGALLGANGAIYAIRRSEFSGINGGTIVDDLVIPLVMHLRTGCRIVYDPSAVAREETAPSLTTEFRRRARIGAGGFHSLSLVGGIALPRHGWLAFSFISHKLLRWLCPFWMLGALATNAMLADDPFYRLLLAVQLLGYGLSALGWHHRTHGWRVVRLSTMFTTMNAALLVGFWMWASGTQTGIWQRTAR